MEETQGPIYMQIAALVEDAIMDGSLLPGQQAPSTNQLAEFHGINPATARKGITVLVELGVLEKRRGLGMFVTEQAPYVIQKRRQTTFYKNFIEPMLQEAKKLGIDKPQILKLITQSMTEKEDK